MPAGLAALGQVAMDGVGDVDMLLPYAGAATVVTVWALNKAGVAGSVIHPILYGGLLALLGCVFMTATSRTTMRPSGDTSPRLSMGTVVSFAALLVAVPLMASCLVWIALRMPYGGTVINWGLGLLCFSVAFTIVDLVLPDNLRQAGESVLGIGWEVLKFVPCLLLVARRRIMSEARSTSPTSDAWFLLALEAVVVAMWFGVPLASSYLSKMGGTRLLDGPVYTNRMHVTETVTSVPTSSSPPSYRYAVSLDLYVNPQPSSTRSAYSRYCNLVDFGGAPVVEYNVDKESLRIRSKQPSGAVTTVAQYRQIPQQTWINVVVNYNGGVCDVFIDGRLMGTLDGVMTSAPISSATVGENGGIMGGVRNVMVFSEPLTREWIWALNKSPSAIS